VIDVDALARLLFESQMPADNWTFETIDGAHRDEFRRRATYIADRLAVTSEPALSETRHDSGIDAALLEKALWAAEIWDEDEGWIGPMPVIAAKIAAEYARLSEGRSEPYVTTPTTTLNVNESPFGGGTVTRAPDR
jgi:hypothetical protein